MSKVININDYTHSKDDIFILDTNIYIYLYLSTLVSNNQYIEDYTEFYSNILETGSQIITTSIQISEFFNYYAKRRFHEYKYQNHLGDSFRYRDYKLTGDFLDVLNELKLLIQNRVLANSTPINDEFNELSIVKMLRTGKPYDFNDEFLIRLALKKEAKILTHDLDIVEHDSDVEVVTIHKN